VRQLELVLAGLVWASALLVTPAFADVGPDTYDCQEGTVGFACEDGGPNANQGGACVEDMCTRQTPSGEMSYACYVCKAGETPTRGSRSSEEEKDEGCSASGAPASGWPSLFAPLVALGLAAARRRRSRD
jgi:MYXO-CTERM domain-containing protein